MSEPDWCASASFAFGSRRLFASETPLENANQLATAQTTTRAAATATPSRSGGPSAAWRGAVRRARPAVVRAARAGARSRAPLRDRAGRVRLREPFPWRGRPDRRGRASLRAPSGGLRYPPDMSAKRVIGVDLGGTKILAGVVDAEGRIHETVERPTVTTSQDRPARRARGSRPQLPSRRTSKPLASASPPASTRGPASALGAVNIPIHEVVFRERDGAEARGARSASRTTRTRPRTPSSGSVPPGTSTTS